MIRVNDESLVLLQQAYLLLNQVEVKGHQNVSMVSGAMDRLQKVVGEMQDFVAEKDKRTARSGAEPQEEKPEGG